MKKKYCKCEKISPADGGYYFYGYYDKCPWSRDEKKLLAHRCGFQDRVPEAGDVAEVGYIDLDSGNFVPFGSSTAWNFQQGTQLQWMQRNGKEVAIYNIRTDSGEIRAEICDPENRTRELLGSSIYTLSPRGDVALTLNYARLFNLRPDYGIAGLTDPGAGVSAPEDDGIFSYDLANGTSSLLISIGRLKREFVPDEPDDVQYKINHLMFNPEGTRFCFMLRYDNHDKIHKSIFFTAAVDGSDIRLLFSGMVSHHGWGDANTILAWAGERKLLLSHADGRKSLKQRLLGSIRKSLKPIYYFLGKPRFLMNKVVGDSYYLFTDAPQPSHRRIARNQLTCDGHCTFMPGGEWIVTDGYTDRKNRLPLFLWSVDGGFGCEIGRFPTPRELDGPLRVDLHPRFNHDGSKVCVDSAQDGKRGIYILDVKAITGTRGF